MKIYLATAFVFCFSAAAIAQEKNAVLQVVEHRGQLLVQQTPKELLNQVAAKQDNVIAVIQIGNQNTLNTTIQAATGQSTFHQEGSNNTIDVAVSAQEVNYTIAQYGNKNSFETYSATPANQQSLELIQQGSQQDVSIFGSNSMSNNMKITLEGNDRSLTIRNFN